MLRTLLRFGTASGLLAASATAGALLAFSARQGSPARPFNAAAQLLLGARALRADGWSWVTVVGIVVHFGWAVALALLVALVASRMRSRWRALVAFATSLVLFLLHPRLAPFAMADGFPPLLMPGQRALLYALLAIAIALGMRLATVDADEQRAYDWSDPT